MKKKKKKKERGEKRMDDCGPRFRDHGAMTEWKSHLRSFGVSSGLAGEERKCVGGKDYERCVASRRRTLFLGNACLPGTVLVSMSPTAIASRKIWKQRSPYTICRSLMAKRRGGHYAWQQRPLDEQTKRCRPQDSIRYKQAAL